MSLKPFKTYAEQASILISRGLGDEAIRGVMERRLAAVGYYRLSAYSYPFRKTVENDGQVQKLNEFREGTTFDRVWDYYLFDRRLRLLIIDAIERVEVAWRVQIAYEWALREGIPNPQSRPGSFATKFRKISKEERLKTFQYYYNISTEDFACHHREDLKIAKVEDLPAWVFIQFSTFGSLHKLFEDGLPLGLKQTIARRFGFQDEGFFTQVFALLLAARNACAHHARVWNKEWLYDAENDKHPLRKRFVSICGLTSDPNWSSLMAQFDRTKTAFLLSLLCVLLEKTASTSHWKDRVKKLLTERAPVPSITREMGFPVGWQQHPLWK